MHTAMDYLPSLTPFISTWKYHEVTLAEDVRMSDVDQYPVIGHIQTQEPFRQTASCAPLCSRHNGLTTPVDGGTPSEHNEEGGPVTDCNKDSGRIDVNCFGAAQNLSYEQGTSEANIFTIKSRSKPSTDVTYPGEGVALVGTTQGDSISTTGSADLPHSISGSLRLGCCNVIPSKNVPASHHAATSYTSSPLIFRHGFGQKWGKASPNTSHHHESIVHPKISFRWEIHGYDATVKWDRIPDIESIRDLLRCKFGTNKHYNIEHMWDGAYNKFYSVDMDDKRYILKLTLPVCPRTKTESEVTTIRWTAASTNLRSLVPDVIDYDSSANNPIGCEWILMRRLEGVPLSTCWREVSLGSKERIVKTLAEYASHVYRNQFKQIGSLYSAPLPGRGRRYQVGKLVSMRLFWNKGKDIESERGPFPTNREWAVRRLNIAHEQLWDHFNKIKSWPKTEKDLLWRMLGMSGVEARLWTLYDVLFPPTQLEEEPDDHEIMAIGKPQLIHYPQTPPLTPHGGTLPAGTGSVEEDVSDDGISVSSANISLRGGNGYHSSLDEEFQSRLSRARHMSDFGDWQPLRPNSEDYLRTEDECINYAEPTMLWHNNLSTDNILVDPETHRLTGILDWDCVSCIPVPLACDWPAFLSEGQHRTTEPEIEDFAIFFSEEDNNSDDAVHCAGDSDMLFRRYARSEVRRAHGSRGNHPIIRQQRGHIALQANYWRAQRDFELTYLRKTFIQEMAGKCPSWYETWRQSKVHKDYEAAIQNCDNEHMIGKVERWCEEVDRALEEGLEIKPPHVMSLHCDMHEGSDWYSWQDLDDLSTEWMKPVRDQQRQVQEWLNDIDELHAARKALPNAKGTTTRISNERTNAKKTLTKAQSAVEETSTHLAEFEAMDSSGYDAEELEHLQRQERWKLDKAKEALQKAEDKIARAELRGGTAEVKRKAAEDRYQAAMLRIQASDWFQKFDHKREFNRRTWRNLEKALLKEYGNNKWWKHRVEPLGECRKKPEPANADADTDVPGNEASEPVVLESDVSEEE